MTVRVPAKVNLQLSVGPAGVDGYHELATVFQAVGIFDEVTARPTAGSGVSLSLSGDADGVEADPDNLAWRAAVLLADHAGVAPDVDLHVRKAIPVAGGFTVADPAGPRRAPGRGWKRPRP